MKAFFLILSLLGPSLIRCSSSPSFDFNFIDDSILNFDIFDDFLKLEYCASSAPAAIPETTSEDAEDEMDQVQQEATPSKPTLSKPKPSKRSRAKSKGISKRKYLSELRLQRSEEKPNFRTPFHYRVKCNCEPELVFKYAAAALEHLNSTHDIPKNSNFCEHIDLIDYQNHAQDFPYTCSFCPYRSVSANNLRTHNLRYHV